MASPTIVATTFSNSSSGSTSFTVNTGSPVSGEGVVIILSRNGGTGSVTWSDSYIELYDLNDDDGFACGAAAYIQAGGSEPSTITVTSTTSVEFSAVCYRVSGHLDFSTQAPDIATVVNGGNTTSHDPASASVTGGAADILALTAASIDTHNVSVTGYPTSYTNTGRLQSGTSGSQCQIAYATRSLSSVSSEDPAAFTISNTRRAVLGTILIQEAASGSYTLTADTAAYTVSGTALDLDKSSLLAADTVAYTYTGTALDLNQGFTLVAATEAYSYTGTALDLTYASVGSFTLTADTGTYTYTGTAASITKDLVLTADTDSYSYAGTALALNKGSVLTADTDSYSYTGTNLRLIKDILALDTVSYTYQGASIDLAASGQVWTNQPDTSGIWTTQTDDSGTWTIQ